MYNYPSRNDKRQARFYSKAEKGITYSDEVLYPSEARKLVAQGFQVTNVKDFDSKLKSKLISATVSWEKAYGCAIPYLVHAYIIGEIETFPSNAVKSFAQELFVIATKAMNKKS